ncbi:MAG TPA: SOS response-associated peptidase [Bacteroidia bacterium]|nr:SOS response-associated peptidase [Bacteroidia bacterium]
MCYNVEAKARALKKYMKYHGIDQADMNDLLGLDMHMVSGFSHPNMAVVTAEAGKPIQVMKWGLIPPWVKDEKQAKEMSDMCLNAKSETIFEKPSFRSIGKKRGLLPVTGFYEWREFNKKKYPYYIHLKTNEPFAFGCVYDTWVNKETGEIRQTFSIITTEANPLMAKIHNSKLRMPLIIPEDKEATWIKPDLNKEEIKQLMIPFDENLMQAHTISKRITSRKENPNVPEVSDSYTYTELDPF